MSEPKRPGSCPSHLERRSNLSLLTIESGERECKHTSLQS